MAEEGTLTIETLCAVLLLVVFVLCGPFFEKIHFHYAHESGITMLLGIVVTIIMQVIEPDVNLFFVLIKYLLL